MPPCLSPNCPPSRLCAPAVFKLSVGVALGAVLGGDFDGSTGDCGMGGVLGGDFDGSILLRGSPKFAAPCHKFLGFIAPKCPFASCAACLRSDHRGYLCSGSPWTGGGGVGG